MSPSPASRRLLPRLLAIRLSTAAAAVSAAFGLSASRAAFGVDDSAASWFDAKIDSYSVWPTNNPVEFGGEWLNSRVATLRDGALSVDASNEPLSFAAVEAKPLSDVPSRVVVGFDDVCSVASSVPDVPHDGPKAGVCLVAGAHSAPTFHVLAFDQETGGNQWLDTGIAAGTRSVEMSIWQEGDDASAGLVRVNYAFDSDQEVETRVLVGAAETTYGAVSMSGAFSLNGLFATAAPSFSVYPEEGIATNFNGAAATYRVTASGWSDLTYFWSLDGVAVSTAIEDECILSWGLADAGRHTLECVVSNGLEEVRRAEWAIDVARRLWVKEGSAVVSPTGADETSAFPTLQAAVDAAQDGDEIWVLPGAYGIFFLGDEKHLSVVAAEGPETTSMDPNQGEYWEPNIYGGSEGWLTVTGFTFNGCSAQYATLRNCICRNIDGIFDPWYTSFYAARLENCLVTSCAALMLFNSSTLVNCTVVGNHVYTQQDWDDHYFYDDEFNIGIIGPGCTVHNSIVRFNCHLNGEERNYWDGTTGWSGGELPTFASSATFPRPERSTGSIYTGNPQFLDSTLGDWRLVAGSPCLNAGDGGYVTSTTDLAGNPRIQGGAVDLGCFEGGVVPDAPDVPINLRVGQGVASETLRVTWNAASMAQAYRVYRAAENDFGNAVFVGETEDLVFFDQTTAADTTYWYFVQSTNVTGASAASSGVSGFRTPPLAVTTEFAPGAKGGDQYSVAFEAEGGREPYSWRLESFGEYAPIRQQNSFESVSGTSVGVSSDDVCASYPLPFSFPFFTETYDTVWISSNGTMAFDGSFSDYAVDVLTLESHAMIAPLWRDLQLSSGGVYASQTSSDSITFRWSGSYYNGGSINFSVTLHADGKIEIKFGSGNANGGLVGISDGNGTTIYEEISTSLANAEDFVFSPVADASWLSIDQDSGVASGRPLENQTNRVVAVVTDAFGNTARREYEIIVSDTTDLRPVVTKMTPAETTIKAFPGDELLFEVEAVDPDGNDIVYTWIVDGVTNMTGLATAFSWTPDAESSGAHTIACRVADGYWDDLAATWTVSLPDWFVSPDGSASNSGKSLATAFDSLQAAIDAASAGDTIYVADGTYTPVSTANKTVRILAAPGASPVIDGGGTNRCVYVGRGSSYRNTVFDGFTLRHGYNREEGGGTLGGTFVNCTIENCGTQTSSLLSSGGSYASGGGAYSANLFNCEVRGCSSGHGAGISYCYASNCVIRGNSSTSIANCYGGGAYYGTLEDCTIRDNRAHYGSGAAYATLTRCTITRNRATANQATYSCTMTGCISWGNTFFDRISSDTWCLYGSATYSCIEGGFSGTGNTSSDPILVEHPDGHIGPFYTSPAMGRGDRSGGLAGVLVRTSATGPGYVSPSVVSAAGSNVVMTATLPNAYHAFSGFSVNGVEMTYGMERDGLDYRLSFAVPDGTNCVDVVAEFPPTTFHVKPDGSNTNDGLSWATARATITSAAGSAVSFDTVLVTNGVYSSFSATKNAALTIRSVEGPKSTVVDGGGSSRCATLGYVSAHTATVVEGITLRNGYSGSASGGGAFCGTLRNCILSGNRSYNSSSYGGGGSAYSNLRDCIVTNNSAYNGGGTWHGTITDCTIVNNSASYDGGGALSLDFR